MRRIFLLFAGLAIVAVVLVAMMVPSLSVEACGGGCCDPCPDPEPTVEIVCRAGMLYEVTSGEICEPYNPQFDMATTYVGMQCVCTPFVEVEPLGLPCDVPPPPVPAVPPVYHTGCLITDPDEMVVGDFYAEPFEDGVFWELPNLNLNVAPDALNGTEPRVWLWGAGPNWLDAFDANDEAVVYDALGNMLRVKYIFGLIDPVELAPVCEVVGFAAAE